MPWRPFRPLPLAFEPRRRLAVALFSAAVAVSAVLGLAPEAVAARDPRGALDELVGDEYQTELPDRSGSNLNLDLDLDLSGGSGGGGAGGDEAGSGSSGGARHGSGGRGGGSGRGGSGSPHEDSDPSALSAPSGGLGEIGGVLMWVVLGVALVLLVAMVVRARRGEDDEEDGEDAEEDEEVALSQLVQTLQGPLPDYERLAAEGRYAEAIHALLLHVLAGLVKRSQAQVRDSLTSRELAGRLELSDEEQNALRVLVQEAEVCHFGERAADALQFARCKQAAERLANAGRGGAGEREAA